MNVAPHNVSGRVVKISIGSSCSERNRTCAPSLRPIQLVCISRTRAGQSIPEKSSSSSAYFVVRKYHCSRFFLMTDVLHRSQCRSSPHTCSRASVVWQCGHQSTGDIFLYASPCLNNCEKNHCVHL